MEGTGSTAGGGGHWQGRGHLTQTDHVGRVCLLVLEQRKQGNDGEGKAHPHHPKVAERPLAHGLDEHEDSAHGAREENLK